MSDFRGFENSVFVNFKYFTTHFPFIIVFVLKKRCCKMMEGRDWLSMFVGFILTVFGALPLLARVIPALQPYNFTYKAAGIFIYIVAIMGFYLIVNSIIEITNSNSIGGFSFLVALIFFAVGVLQVLQNYNVISFFKFNINPIIYYIIFVVEGVFLMIAAFAMEL